MGTFDVVTMGRVSVDIYPQQSGPLHSVRTYAQSLGGSATNVAVAAARLGRRTAVITATGSDPFAPFVHQALTSFGVDTRWVTEAAGGQTPIAFAELNPATNPLFVFYRPRAPDMQLHLADLDLDAMCSSQIFWTTGTGLSAQPSRDTTLGAMREYRRRHPSGECIHDLDWRPMLWADAERADASRWAKEAAAMATVVLGNLHEVDMALGTGQDHRAAATGLLDQGVRIAVIKLGERGVYARSAAGDEVMAPPVPVTVVCGGGAGDAFGGAFCHGLLSGWGLEQIMRFANGAGAIVASQLACSDAMPTVAEVESILDRTNAVVMPQLEQAP